MNENMTIDMERDQESGQITYANEVIATIVSVATSEVEGISGIAGTVSPLSGRMNKGKIPRGVRVDMNGGDVSVDVSVTVDYGMPIQKVGRSAQENVRKSIESMTGLHVDKVDLHVVGVSFEKENQEMLQSQKLASISVDDSAHDEPEETKEEPVVVELVQEESVSVADLEDGEETEKEEE
ncbi:MAG: Asp23/Gls24 family envelope stress response protein [Clostridia bacterium]|nr:Asp23/Gls24 family envelope stress response protein [Clostridia bacterium]